MLAPKSHNALSKYKVPMKQGVEKLHRSLSLGGNFFKITTKYSLLRPIIAKSAKYHSFEMISFRYLAYFGI